MKKSLVIALFMSVLLGTTAYAGPDEIKFRGHEWGEDINKIAEIEVTDDMVEDVDYAFTDGALILINGTVSVFDCYTYFNYNEDNKLYSGIYLLTEKHANDNKYYDDFLALEEALTSVYGRATIAKDNWNDDLYKDSPEDIGIAIAAEHLTLYRQWTAKDGSACTLACYGDNFHINNVIYYDAPTSIDLKPEDNSKTNGL